MASQDAESLHLEVQFLCFNPDILSGLLPCFTSCSCTDSLQERSGPSSRCWRVTPPSWRRVGVHNDIPSRAMSSLKRDSHGGIRLLKTPVQEDFGLECVSAGERGPMSMDKAAKHAAKHVRATPLLVLLSVLLDVQVPGKFINMGNKKDEYKQFCRKFAAHMTCEDDWWGMLARSLELQHQSRSPFGSSTDCCQPFRSFWSCMTSARMTASVRHIFFLSFSWNTLANRVCSRCSTPHHLSCCSCWHRSSTIRCHSTCVQHLAKCCTSPCHVGRSMSPTVAQPSDGLDEAQTITIGVLHVHWQIQS